MRTLIALLLPVFTISLGAQTSGGSQSPNYTAGSIVNAASNFPGPIAPNAIVSLYGNLLSWNTRALTVEDIRTGQLPALLPGAGVSVSINHMYARLYYVSPTQINLLVPAQLVPDEDYAIQVTRDGVAGPVVTLRMAAAVPGLFMQAADTIVATRPDGSVVTRDNPAHAGDVVVLYATGLGQTIPLLGDGEIPTAARRITERASFQVLVDGAVVDDERILYVGVTPGFAGLYQVNLVLPEDCAVDPEIRLTVAGNTSPPGPRLPVQ